MLFVTVAQFHMLMILSTKNFTTCLTFSYLISFLIWIPANVILSDGVSNPVDNEYAGTLWRENFKSPIFWLSIII